MPQGKAITKDEYAEIDIAYKGLYDKMLSKATDLDKDNITKAYDLILSAHKFQSA